MNAPIPTSFRRHRTLLLVTAGIVWLLVLIVLLAWWLLPRWAPNFVIRYSPMPDMVFRAAMEGNDVDQDAITVLQAMGDRANHVMVPYLTSANDQERAFALRVLGKSKDPRYFSLLLAGLTDGKAFVRADAARALGDLADPRAIQPLFAFFPTDRATDEEVVVAAVATALEQLPAALVAEAAEPLMGKSYIIPLILTDNTDPRVPVWLDRALRVPGIIPLVPTGKPIAAAMALAGSPQPEATRLFIQALGDVSPEIRGRAMFGLRRLGHSVVKPEFRTAAMRLLQDPDARVLTQAVRYCSENLLDGATLQIRALLDDPDPQRRVAATKAYTWSFHDPEATEKLLRFAQHSEDQIRVAAIAALGRIPKDSNPQIIAALLAALHDPARTVRCTGINALQHLQHRSHDATTTSALVDLLVRSLDPLDPPLVTGVITALGNRPLRLEHQRVIVEAKQQVAYVTPPNFQMIPPACVLPEP